jgi:predicted branched-subunit amino acid permease
MAQRSATFTWKGVTAGALAVGALGPSVALYGIAFGIMAAAKGLSAIEAALFSALINAGGAQFATLQAWAEPVPILAVVFTTLAMNARYLLLGATLRPWMGELPLSRSLPTLFVLGDGNWALALREHEAGRDDAAFLLGSGAALWLVWVVTTAIGYGLGNVLGDPRRLGIDFMLAAFFAAMAVIFLRSSKDVAPFLGAVAVAISVDFLHPGPFSLLLGALAGSLIGALRHGSQA